MTYTAAIAVLETHLDTVGAGLTRPILDVRQGEPPNVPAPLLWYAYQGDRESTTGGNTLGKTNIEELVEVGACWPITDPSRSDRSPLEALVHEAKAAIKAALWGDVTLGGTCIGLDVGEATAEYAVIDNALVRTLRIPVAIDLAFVDDIAL
jgi:hypothetical protein